ncbi:hypothetical protein ACYOEI_00225 [Singulisphaera rosea]
MDWLRLWHDMPNDPKWRTISRVSGRSISEVISVYIHMLICASNASERGRTQGWNDEDVASALDLEAANVEAIRIAMQGRVLEGDAILGWDKRQPKREDNSAVRAKEWRQKQRDERERTQPNARKRPEKIREDKKEDSGTDVPSSIPSGLPDWLPGEEWAAFKQMRQKLRSPLTQAAEKLAIRDLDSLRQLGHDPKAVLEQSILRSWRGLFALKGETNQKGPNHGKHSKFADQDYRAGADGFVTT